MLMAVVCSVTLPDSDLLVRGMVSPATRAFDVNVKDSQGGSAVVSVLPTWNVAQVKLEIALKMGITVPEFVLVFAGQTLSDDVTLEVSRRCS